MPLIRHIITGGPCSGKTTTIEALRNMGFQVIEEASRQLIEEQNRLGGDLVPWKRLYDFNVAVSDLQERLESAVTEGVYFQDRGIIDNLAYCEWGNIQPPPNLLERAEKANYSKVFLLLPLPFFEKDDVRKDSNEDREKLTILIKKAYESRGFEVIEIQPGRVEERAEKIISLSNSL